APHPRSPPPSSSCSPPGRPTPPGRPSTSLEELAAMSDNPAIPGPNGGDLVVALMDALGIDTAFGVVSVHNMPLIDAISRDRRFVPVRHEAAAVNAADGYGRARGGIGLAITSTGTGAGNAAGSLIESLAAGSR